MIVARHGLSPEEYARILGILGRAPNITEFGVFSMMWSEHNSRPPATRSSRCRGARERHGNRLCP
jgi:hypothetical protein